MNAILRRVLLIPVLLFVVATLGFFLLRAAPGGPFDRERAAASKEVEAALRAKYHLDEPLFRQYLRYVSQLARFDFGPSLKYRNHSVNDILAQTIPVSLVLGLLSFGVAIGLGVPSGFAAAVWRGGVADKFSGVLAVAGICVPVFVLGPLLVLVFGIRFKWLPVALWGSWQTAILPMAALGIFFAARVSRLMREGALGILGSPHVRTARAKGAGEFLVLIRHVVPAALLPVVSYSGPMLADLLTGSFVVENIFQIPGTGAFFVNSFFSRDYTMMIGLVILYSALLQGLNLVVDLVIRSIDSRIRDE
jgi:oligopeptide transport system permease protein